MIRILSYFLCDTHHPSSSLASRVPITIDAWWRWLNKFGITWFWQLNDGGGVDSSSSSSISFFKLKIHKWLGDRFILGNAHAANFYSEYIRQPTQLLTLIRKVHPPKYKCIPGTIRTRDLGWEEDKKIKGRLSPSHSLPYPFIHLISGRSHWSAGNPIVSTWSDIHSYCCPIVASHSLPALHAYMCTTYSII